MRIAKKKVLKFDELSDEVQEKVIQYFRENFFNYEWWDSVYEDAKEIGKRIGVDISNIYFSGFWSQGDGACFEGSYTYKKQAVKKVKEYAPKDEELYRIVVELQKIQKQVFYSITASVKQSGHYYHKYCTDINVDMAENIKQKKFAELEDAICELLRDFMDWIYQQLRVQCEYLTSEEAIKETIEANEYEFTADGKIWH